MGMPFSVCQNLNTMYIIVWRNSHKSPHLSETDHGFLESFDSFERAKEYADEIVEQEGKDNGRYYYDYQIYQEAKD